MPRLFDIQHYAVHDGPGIRTLVFFKGCPLRCAWCSNPESQSPLPEIRHRFARCKLCHLCQEACIHRAIHIDKTVSINRSLCKKCNDRPCIDACPESALELIGGTYSIDEVVKRVVADADFYRNSGGGVTFSGGEPLAQAEVLNELLKRFKVLGIHRALETSGCASPESLAQIEPKVDLFLFDIKLIDPSLHRGWCGEDNGLILRNLKWLAGRRRDDIILRFTLVPGATDDPSNLRAISELKNGLKIRQIDVQPYHALGTTKYAEIGHLGQFATRPPQPTHLETCRQLLSTLTC